MYVVPCRSDDLFAVLCVYYGALSAVLDIDLFLEKITKKYCYESRNLFSCVAAKSGESVLSRCIFCIPASFTRGS
jgi:hypothetical protein